MKSRLLVLFAMMSALLCASVGDAAPPRPDILLIMPDQWRGDCLSTLGHPAVRTPRFDRLAEGGVLFRRAYSTVPSCIPVRYALLTGQAPQTSGVVGFQSPPITRPTLPGVLTAAGYATALVGRSMHQTPETDDLGYQRRILGSTYVSFDEYDKFLKAAAPECGGIRKLITEQKLDCNGWEAVPWPLDDRLHPTAWIVEQSRRLVAETPLEKPLFLTTSFYSPHPPLFPPKKYFDKYMKMDLPKPAVGDWVDWTNIVENGHGARPRVRLTGDTLRRAQAGYFGLIEHIDAEIGPLVEEFRRRSEKAGRPWLVVVTSDHGEMLGDHGLQQKGCRFYEGAVRVPLIFSWPGRFKAGLRSSALVELVDLPVTLMEATGLSVPADIHGKSLLPILEGKAAPARHREFARCEYHDAMPFKDGDATHANMIVTGTQHKLVVYHGHDVGELYDLRKDPNEFRNLWDDAESREVKHELMKRLFDATMLATDPGQPRVGWY